MYTKVVAAIIHYKKKILSTQRKYSKNSDISLKYEFPGGKVKLNEKKEIALVREIKEELDLKVKNIKFYFKNTFNYSNINAELYFYTCHIDQFSINLKVHQNYKLLEINQLQDVEWLQGNYPVIKKIQSDYNIKNKFY